MKTGNLTTLATNISYGTSLGSGGYWFLQLLDKISPTQWSAIGVLGSLLLGLLTYLTSLYFRIKDARQSHRDEHDDPAQK